MLEQRLNVIEFFLDLDNQSVVENLTSCLRHVYRLTNTVLICCSGPQAKPSNWYKLYKVQFHSLLSLSIFLSPLLISIVRALLIISSFQTISHVICIADICEEHAERIELFKRIAESVTIEVQYVKYFIEYIVDFGESRRERKLVVKPNVDPLLDERAWKIFFSFSSFFFSYIADF